MGFPVTDPIQRRRWYKASNFTYQSLGDENYEVLSRFQV